MKYDELDPRDMAFFNNVAGMSDNELMGIIATLVESIMNDLQEAALIECVSTLVAATVVCCYKMKMDHTSLLQYVNNAITLSPYLDEFYNSQENYEENQDD